jgi:hypothetical protein
MRLFFLASVAWALAGLPAAATTTDFVCIPSPGGLHPLYYENQVKSCGQSADVHSGVCTESVQCAYLSASARAQVLTLYYAHRDPGSGIAVYEGIPLEQREELIKSYMMSQLSFHPSTVSCASTGARSKDGKPLCPPPDECKSDALINPVVADVGSSSSKATLLGTDPEPRAAGANPGNPSGQK